MKKEDIIKLARDACDEDKVDAWQNGFWTLTQEELERFATLVAAAAVEQERKEFAIHAVDIARKAIEEEREACAKVCDDFERAKWESVKDIASNGGRLAFAGPMHCASAIRARGNQ